MIVDPYKVQARRLVDIALKEDLGGTISVEGDVTSRLIIPSAHQGQAAFAARQKGVLAGIEVAEMVFASLDNSIQFRALRADRQTIQAGDIIARVQGSIRSILAAERTALNFLQHMSGIATLTRQFVDAVVPLPTKILDTRKTIPGLRYLAKHAVLCGGGDNHRMGLNEVLIKDNHLAALREHKHPIIAAIDAVRNGPVRGWTIEIEVDSLDQLDEALPAKPDIILLDNMPLDMMREAVRRRNAVAPEVLLEASGGVTLQTVRAIAETGVDRISVGALTHSAPALDIALDYDA